MGLVASVKMFPLQAGLQKKKMKDVFWKSVFFYRFYICLSSTKKVWNNLMTLKLVRGRKFSDEQSINWKLIYKAYKVQISI